MPEYIYRRTSAVLLYFILGDKVAERGDLA
jgi:hypothetical protein